MKTGTLHPITQYLRRAIHVFTEMGFEVLDSPEIVSEHNNFDDLLIPPNHPARTMHDTFWLKDGRLPRTHTSAHQIPALASKKPPVRLIIPGRVFRNEATDSSHEINFLNLEGVAIGKDITLANLKATLLTYIHTMYGPSAEVKFVPSYFPFVEPGLELYMKHRGKWLEMLGAGMIHPGVLKNMGLDPKQYQGFAFGMGIDRFAMLAHRIDDIRDLFGGNLRFLKQFQENL